MSKKKTKRKRSITRKNSHGRGHMVVYQQRRVWGNIYKNESNPQPVTERSIADLTGEERARFGL